MLAFFVFLGCAGSALAQENITFEAQRHENYGRLILTFPDRLNLPEHTVTSDNGVLVISVPDTPMAGVLPDVGTILSEYLAVARFDPDRTGIRMGMREQFALNTMAAGEQLYIDLLPPDWVGLPPALPPEIITKLAERAEEAARIAEERRRAELAIEYDPRPTIRVGRHPTFSRIEFTWNVGTKAEFVREGENASIRFDWPVPVDLYEILSDRPEQLGEVTNIVHGGETEIAMAIPEDVPVRFYEQSSTEFILDIDHPGDAEQEFDLAEVAASLSQPEAPAAQGEHPEDTVEPVRDETATVQPYVSTVGQTVRIVFPFAQETPAAVFRRGNVVWMLFDTPARLVSPDAQSGEILDGLASDLTVESTGASYVVRMVLDDNRLATLASEGRSWVLSLGDILLSAVHPVTLERRRSQSGLYEVVADLERPANVHQLRDPDVGDILDVVTTYPPARGVVRDLGFVDFQAPRSVHGLVVKPLHEGVSVSIEDRYAVIAADGGLTVSVDAGQRLYAPDEASVSALDLNAMMTPNPDEFGLRRDEYMARAAMAEGRDLDRARLDLAQFYLANDFAFEAIGVLNVLRRDLRQHSLEPAMNATLAAANALAGRHADALDLLNADAMLNDADAMIWRTIAKVDAGDFAGARLDAFGGDHVVDNYPNWIRARFHLAAIRAAVEQSDATMAADMIRAVDLAALTPDQVAQYQLLSARLDHINGLEDEALEGYGRVIAADRRGSSAEAVLRTIEILDGMGQLDVEKAIHALAVQSTIWRGDQLEIDIVAKLTDLQYRHGDYRDAFVLTREMAADFADNRSLDALLTRARTEFSGLFLDGQADALDPVSALSIYYDYRHLTPPGAEGDMMIRNLAQRLIEVDLLAQASELLSYQVENRLDGAARAQVAADLAVVYIANRDPNSALRVLYDTRLAGLPPGLERQRRVLEASALIHAHRHDLALDLLSSLTGRDTELLRIDALWQANRFSAASELIEALYSPDLSSGGLSPMARTNVVKAAVGYVLSNDQIGLARLRSRFSEAMSTTPEWPVFAFVVENVDPNGVNFREIARQVADTQAINAFLNAYREIYSGPGTVTPLRAAPETGAVASL
ncbi:hypothetical protein [Pelagibacterium halotolerans]|uniref:hypothetical protein n=1 Tax=Pelagibacterium halotolerans TaxID=531813 RepID=UPI0002E1B8EE|nr:hypothetical protein [Pelagibacterium halotolerans]QJR18327.1 hypothetical protein HKM20_07715 [Pelagibacterium halotolerans]SEA25556.1 hypothetical protein SAMN05428936_102492 [Pelagibacterium halotolerans]